MMNCRSTIFRRLSVGIVFGVGLVLLGFPAVDQTYANPAESVSVRNNRLFVQVTMDGADFEALLDSGAEMTFFDRGFASRVGVLPPDSGETKAQGSGAEEVAVQFAQGITLESVGISIKNMTVAIIDLSDVTERLIGHRVDLVLGRDLFDSARLWLDIEAGQIQTVERTGSPAGVRLDLETQHGIETFPVSVEGHPPVRAEFDLGNGTDVLIGAAYAERIGLTDEGRVIDREMGGGIGGAVEREIVLLRQLDVAGVSFYNVRAAIDPTENAADVNLGVSILRNFVITTDFAERVVWLSPRSGSPAEQDND